MRELFIPVVLELVDAFRDFGPGRKRSCHLQASPHQSHPGQGSGGHLGPELSSGRFDPTLDLSVLEPAGGHHEEVWRRSDHHELQETQPDQQPQPAAYSWRGSSPLDSLGKGRVFSLFDLVTSFHQITAHKDTVPLTAFRSPTGLYEWLVMPQARSASPGWFVKVMNEVIKVLAQVAAYFDDVNSNSQPTTHLLPSLPFVKVLVRWAKGKG